LEVGRRCEHDLNAGADGGVIVDERYRYDVGLRLCARASWTITGPLLVAGLGRSSFDPYSTSGDIAPTVRITAGTPNARAISFTAAWAMSVRVACAVWRDLLVRLGVRLCFFLLKRELHCELLRNFRGSVDVSLVGHRRAS
jgi:hypothetical protein